MNTYKTSDSSHWEPLNFTDFSSKTACGMKGKQSTKTVEFTPIKETSIQVENEVDQTSIEQELERLKTEITEKAYQEGLKQGKEDGFAEGKKAGYEQGYQLGQQEGKQHIYQQLAEQIHEEKMNAVQAIANLAANFQKAINDIDEQVVPQLTDLALVAAQKIVGDIPKTKHKQLTQTIKALVNQFPPLYDHVELHVNPDDITTVETLLTDELNKCGWKLVGDSSIETGGCKILSDKNEIDATVASKWQVITDAISGDEI